MSRAVLVIGYGNPVRGDDGAGPRVAGQLAGCGAKVMTAHQLLPELAEDIAQSDEVIFVDAHAGIPPGEILWERLDATAPAARRLHHMEPVEVLALADALYDARPRALLVGIGAASFDCTDTLSPEVERAAGLAAARIREHLRST
jgi:hydrogenase maturation protease